MGLYIGLVLLPIFVMLFSLSQAMKAITLVGKDRTIIEDKVARQKGDKGKIRFSNYRIWLGRWWAIPLLVPFVDFQNMCKLYWRDIYRPESASWWNKNLKSPYYQQPA